MPPVANVHTGVCAVVESIVDGHDSMLLVQRGGQGEFGSNGYGTWGLPGGWLEFAEDPFDAARRETEEETGVQVRPVAADGFTSNLSDNGRFHIVTLFVRCEHIAGEAVNAEPDKALAVRWIPRDLLTELDLFAPLDAWWRRPR